MYLLKKLLDMSTIIFYSRKNMGERNSERSYLMRKRNIILGITNNSPIENHLMFFRRGRAHKGEWNFRFSIQSISWLKNKD
jgi:hypothetical protein